MKKTGRNTIADTREDADSSRLTGDFGKQTREKPEESLIFHGVIIAELGRRMPKTVARSVSRTLGAVTSSPPHSKCLCQ